MAGKHPAHGGKAQGELVVALNEFKQLAADGREATKPHGIRTSIIHGPFYAGRNRDDPATDFRAKETFHRLNSRFTLAEQRRQLLRRGPFQQKILARRGRRTAGDEYTEHKKMPEARRASGQRFKPTPHPTPPRLR